MITGSPKDHTGFGLFLDNTNKQLAFYIYSSIFVNSPLFYTNPAGSFSAQAWIYFGIVYDYNQGKFEE